MAANGQVMMIKKISLNVMVLTLLTVCTTMLRAVENDEKLQRGLALHDTICRGCHEDDMYKDRHLSRNPYFDLHTQTKLWSEFVKVKWTDAEIDDVVYFLKQTYYSESKNTR